MQYGLEMNLNPISEKGRGVTHSPGGAKDKKMVIKKWLTFAGNYVSYF